VSQLLANSCLVSPLGFKSFHELSFQLRPFAIALGMALSRHIISVFELDAAPGCRKTKQFDALRDSPGEQHISVIVDDPNLDAIHIEDLKSLLTVEEERIVDCRYHPLKLAPGEPTTIISNVWDDTAEPDLTTVLVSSLIEFSVFIKMVEGVFNTRFMGHIKAILKRSAFLIAGNNAVYLRLPSEHESEPIRVFSTAIMGHDWLREENKKYYGLVKKGKAVKYPGWDEQRDKEAEKLEEWLLTAEERQAKEDEQRLLRWSAEFGDDSIREDEPTGNESASSSCAAPSAGPPEPKRPRFSALDDSDGSCLEESDS
jgi:hypothetical protein